MLVCNHQSLAKVTSFCVSANRKSLSRVYEFKYFGVMLDPNLSWNDRIDYISAKISARLGMLRKAQIRSYSTGGLYHTIRRHDTSSVWGGCGRTNRDYSDKLQRRAVRIIEGR